MPAEVYPEHASIAYCTQLTLGLCTWLLFLKLREGDFLLLQTFNRVSFIEGIFYMNIAYKDEGG